MIIFDVDGTLINERDEPRWEVIDLLRAFHQLGYEIGVWSGGGFDYAKHWCDKLGLNSFVSWIGVKGLPVDAILYIDDQPGADLGVAPTIIV